MSKRKNGKELEVENLRHREALSRREVAFLTGRSERHIINLVGRGLLVEVSLGRRKLIPRWSLDKLLRGETQADTAAATDGAA